MNLYTAILRDGRVSVKIFVGVLSLLLLFLVLPGSVEARDYHIQASDGELYTVTLGEKSDIRNFSVRKSDGEMLRGATKAERAVATELYFAAKLLWDVIPFYSPEQAFEDWEDAVKVIAKDALKKLKQRQIASFVGSHSFDILVTIATGGANSAPLSVTVLSEVNSAIADHLKRRVLLDATILAQAAAREWVAHERILRDFWFSYETRSASIPMAEINAAWKSYEKLKRHQSLATELVFRYLQVPDLKERLGTFFRSIVPFAKKIETLKSIQYSNKHLGDLSDLRKDSMAGIHRQALISVRAKKIRFRTELDQAGFFQPRAVKPLRDIRISENARPRRLDVQGYFSPNGDNLTYIPDANDASVAVAMPESPGSSVIIITPKGIGRTSVVVELMNFRGLSVTQSFTVIVEQAPQQPDPIVIPPISSIQRFEKGDAIIVKNAPSSDLYIRGGANLGWDEKGQASDGATGTIIDGPRQSNGFTWWKVRWDPSSKVQWTHQTANNTGWVVEASDRVEYLAIRPPDPVSQSNDVATEVAVTVTGTTVQTPNLRDTDIPDVNIPTTPSSQEFEKGDGVIVQNTAPSALNIRGGAGLGWSKKGNASDGATGAIIDGPRQANGYTWWKVRWDTSNKIQWIHQPANNSGWSVGSIDSTEYLAVRPPDPVVQSFDLAIQSFTVNKTSLTPGENFTLNVTIHNDGPRRSAASDLSYYHSSVQGRSPTDPPQLQGAVSVGTIAPEQSKTKSIRLKAPSAPGTYYYGAWLTPNTDDTNIYNDVATEVGVTVAAATVQTSGSSDLVIESISADYINMQPGERFTVTAVVQNIGGQRATSTTLRYYRSSDPNISAKDTEIERDSLGVLDSNETSEERGHFDAPNMPGTYYYGVCVDSLRLESNKDNNCSEAIQITVRPSEVPDVVVSLSASKVTLEPSERFRLDAVVRNQGREDARSTTLRYYRSSDSVVSPDDTEVKTDHVRSLDPDETSDEYQNLNVPEDPGIYYYIACVDSVHDEINTGNNCSTAIAITVGTPVNRVPVAVGSISSRTLTVGGSSELIYVSGNFRDPDNDNLLYTPRSDNTNVVTVNVSGSRVTIMPQGVGSAVVTVTASDGEVTATQRFSVTVTAAPIANRAPVTVGSISSRTLTVGGSSERVNVSVYFQDLDNDNLLYTVGSDNTGVATVDISGSQVTIDPQGVGSAVVTVTASDGELTVTQEFTVTVTSGRNPLITNQDICNRTAQVLNEILDRINIDDCADVSSADLSTITRLRLSGEGITTLRANDFEGLNGLDDLDLSGNSLSSLPVGIFDGLTALYLLDLSGNSLSSLPVPVFDELGALYSLNLGGNSLSSLSVSVFDGLDVLERLDLDDNSLRSLPVDIFDGLRSLTHLNLENSGLSSLSVGVFNGLSALEVLDLRENALSSLPVEVFDGLSALESLVLRENALSSLPAGVFDGLSALESLDLEENQLTTLPAGIFDDILDTLKSTDLDLDASLKTTFGFSTTAQDAAEGETVRVVVNLGQALPVAVRVPYTVGGTATAADYTNLQTPTELLFLAGETSKEIVFTLLEDADTTAETVLLTLGELNDVKLRKSDGSGPDAQLSAYTLLNASQQRVHTVTVTTGGEGVSRPMYWTGGDNKIRRSKMDGTLVQILLDDGNPADIALDISGGRMYWVDSDLDGIRRANLDGSGVVNLVTDLGSPTGLALDISGGKMYWLDYHFDKIQRANLNGSGIEDLVTGLDKPRGIALDVSGGKMYWTDTGTDKIHRANLNGTNVEDLVTGLSNPRAIALDVSDGKMYWVDSSTNKIQRANLNGTNIEDLVTNFDIGADGLALDVSGGKMYWADNQEDKICRANLDGSQIERLYAGGYPIDIALAVGAGAATNAAPSAVSTNSAPRLLSETVLLPNYPNPFNPETWIPYQLAEPADVTISIYAADGKLIRTLDLGHRSVGIYVSRSRAAYWDGRNALGEPVASGVYFYTLTAAEFTATRKMLIRK